jgi:hypothetical protein
MDKPTKEYKLFLEGLEKKDLNKLIEEFKLLKSYTERNDFLNKFVCLDLIPIFENESFIKLFYLDSQAKYLNDLLKLNDLDILKTFVYCYNTNQREFNKNIEVNNLRNKLLSEGYIESKSFKMLDNEQTEQFYLRRDIYYKELNGLKVKCVFDRDKIGVLGSYTKTEEHEGKFILSNNQLYFIPKRHSKTGQLIIGKFYYKVVRG